MSCLCAEGIRKPEGGMGPLELSEGQGDCERFCE